MILLLILKKYKMKISKFIIPAWDVITAIVPQAVWLKLAGTLFILSAKSLCKNTKTTFDDKAVDWAVKTYEQSKKK
mgnify:CR=1 FL=1